MRSTSYSKDSNRFDWRQDKLSHKSSKAPIATLSGNTNTVSQFFWQKRAVRLLLPLIGIGVALLGSCSRSSNTLLPGQDTTPQTLENPRDGNERPLVPTDVDRNFVVEVVEKVEPTVVRITTSQVVQNRVPDAFNDPFFRRFFGDGIPREPQERTVRGIGSGFVINSNGLILTNAHVVNKADIVTVAFSDGRSFEGKVLGEDPVTDIAVVQIPANNLPTVEMANSEQVQPGQWAIAIGNPLGLQETVTVGVVSGIGRSATDIGVSDKRIGFIQTDAAINPGNSGGPLLNARGQVIGVNTAIIRGAQGLGFAIPIDAAQRIAQQLITKGKVEHPFIGIQMVPLTAEVKEKLKNNPNRNIRIEAERGVLIIGIAKGSPADQAGLRAGDVIQSVNNQPVTKAEEVQQLVEESGVGSQLPMQVQRGGQTVELTVRPEPLPARRE
ncbi:MAG: trypsin-like peptidase domain-containing protein [Coleofasciculus sp. S288]|nr:trypsin-like peptidase domain-containing protein [Coleofasciculus sp. S288]